MVSSFALLAGVRRHTRLLPLLAVVAFSSAFPRRALTQAPPSTVTFENRSTEPAFVKLIGLVSQDVEVPAFSSRAVRSEPGTYYILVRYGAPGHYTYAKGDFFAVHHTATQWSEITIVLQKVEGGNYRTRDAAREEFDRVPPSL